MSISPNVGALPKYLASHVMRDMRGMLHEIKQHSNKVLDKLPAVKRNRRKSRNQNSKPLPTKAVISNNLYHCLKILVLITRVRLMVMM